MAQTKGNFRMMDTGTITPLDFGAVGDGTTNDTVALQAAFDTTTANIIDLCGKTYGITATVNITQGNLLVKNGTIKWVGTDVMPYDILVDLAGVEGSTYALVTDANLETSHIIVQTADIGNFAADDYLLLQNTVEIWTDDTGWHGVEHNHAEMVQVRIVDTSNNKVYLMTPLNSNFKGGETNIIKQTLLDNITFDGVNFEGNSVQQIFLGTDPVQGPGTAAPYVKLTIPGIGLGLVDSDFIWLVDLAVDPGVIPGTLATDFEKHRFTIDSFTESAGNTIALVSRGWGSSNPSGTGSDGGANGKVYFGGHHALYIQRCVNLTIKNCQFTKIERGIICSRSYNTLIENNRILGMLGPGGYGILIQDGCTETYIINNKILGTLHRGMEIMGTSGDPINTYIKGNTIKGATGVGIYTYICNFVEIVNNNITMSNTDACDLNRNTYGIQAYSFGLRITDNTIRNFGGGNTSGGRGAGIYYEPRYWVHRDGASSQRSIYSGAFNIGVAQASGAGSTSPTPWAQFINNYIQGRVGAGHWHSNGIVIRSKVVGFFPDGLQIMGNSIKDVACCLHIDGDHSGPAAVGDTPVLGYDGTSRIEGVMINNNILSSSSHSIRYYGTAIHYGSIEASQELGHRSTIVGNILEARDWVRNTGASQQVDPLMLIGKSAGTFPSIKYSAFVGNTLLHGSVSIYTGSSANSPLEYGVLLGNTMHAYKNQSSSSAASYCYAPLSVGKDPIGAPFDSNSPLYNTQIGRLDAGAVNNFWGNSFTGG